MLVTISPEVPNPAVRIKPATSDQLLDIYRLEQHCFEQPWPYPAFQRQLEAEAFLVAMEAGALVGYVVGDLVNGFPGPVGHIKDLAVHPSHRRQGIARRLLQTALRRLAASGAVRAQLEVRESNEGAIALYRSSGFSIDDERPGYYADGETALLMTRRLEPLSSVPSGLTSDSPSRNQ